MRYMGGKAKIAKRIVAFLNQHRRKEGQTFIEPFLGGCNILPLMALPKWGNEINASIILFYEALRDGWVPPADVTEEEYRGLRHAPDSPLKGFARMSCSFGGDWNRGYAKDGEGRNYATSGKNTAMKTKGGLQGAVFSSVSYDQMDAFPPNSLIYCDPPYKGVSGYGNPFDHDAFWQWVRDKTKEGHTVFVSEYAAPPDFVEVWTTERGCGLACGKNGSKAVRVEKIFTWPCSSQS